MFRHWVLEKISISHFQYAQIAKAKCSPGIDYLAIWLSPSVNTQNLRLVRSIRLARALRGIRIVWLFEYVGALRTLALSIISISDGCRDAGGRNRDLSQQRPRQQKSILWKRTGGGQRMFFFLAIFARHIDTWYFWFPSPPPPRLRRSQSESFPTRSFHVANGLRYLRFSILDHCHLASKKKVVGNFSNFEWLGFCCQSLSLVVNW